MTLHPRMPAIAALLLTACAGLGILAGTGQFRTKDLAQATLQDLEKKIVGSDDGRLWLAYGDKLVAANNPEGAAKAYQKAIKLQPDLMDARLNLGLALGAGKDADAFFEYVSRLCINYPKLANDLMKRPELGHLQSHPRWASMAATAQSQAID
jgi:tetratricopeptide (TPR) repeat protein